MKNIIQEIRRDLVENADEKTKTGVQRFFKEKVMYYGVKTFMVEKIAKKYFESIKKLEKKDIFTLCEELFQSDYGEEAWVASNWVYWNSKRFEQDDIVVFEKWIEHYINDWAKCDTFCNHAVGAYIEKFPGEIGRLKKWARSKNRWMKRAASVTLIIPARKGLFLNDIFELADLLLFDPDDMVQKGYGWMLKAASQAHRQEVFEYVMKNKKVMPRTAFRYAIEKMPEDLRKKAMEKSGI